MLQQPNVSNTTVVRLVALLVCISGIVGHARAQEHGRANRGDEWIQQQFDNGAMLISTPARMELVGAPKENTPGVKNYTYAKTVNTSVFTVQYSVLDTDTDEWTPATKSIFCHAVWEAVQRDLDVTFKKSDPSLTVALTESRKAKAGDYDGMEFLFSVGRLKGSMKVIAQGRRAYCALILTPPELFVDWSARFFESFRVLKVRA